jgi:hypothetical protein
MTFYICKKNAMVIESSSQNAKKFDFKTVYLMPKETL